MTDREKLAEAIKRAFFRYGVSDWQAVADMVIEDMK